MSARIGANPEDLDRLAGELHRLSDQLRSTSRHLSSGVHHERAWKGARAQRFRSEWDHTYVPMINSACDWLDHQEKVLQDNANEQRRASGEAVKDYSTGIRGLLHRTERVVDGAAAAVGNWALREADNAEQAWREVESDFKAGLAEMVQSPAFADVMEVAQVVSTVAPLLAIVPGLGEVAVVAGAAASLVLLAGHVCQMANTGEWDYKQLAEDGVGTALSFAGMGALGRAAQGASEVNLLTHLGRDYQTGSVAANMASNVLVLRGAKDLYDIGNTSYDVYTDVRRGDYTDAALDGFGYVSTATEAGGNSIDYRVSALVAGTQGDVDIARDQR